MDNKREMKSKREKERERKLILFLFVKSRKHAWCDFETGSH